MRENRARTRKPADARRVLAASGFFRGLSPAALRLLAEFSAEVEVGPGREILRAGQRAENFYLIRSGCVNIELPVCSHRAVVLQTLGPGDVLGWSWLIPPYRWHLGARAKDAVSALVFDGRRIRRPLLRDPKLACEFYRKFTRVMSQRLEGTIMRMFAD